MISLVLFYENGKMYFTNKSNFEKQIINSLEKTELTGFRDLLDAKFYLEKNFPYEVEIPREEFLKEKEK